jgi:hypothetical protein
VATSKYFTVGAAVSADSFDALQDSVESGTGRLRRHLTTAADGFAVFSGLWEDTTLDTSCTFRAAVDGSIRCLPLTMSRQTVFTDNQCTASVQLARVDECVAQTAFIGQNAGQGQRILAAEPVAGPIFRLEGQSCVEDSAASFFQAGFEHAPSTFVLREIATP